MSIALLDGGLELWTEQCAGMQCCKCVWCVGTYTTQYLSGFLFENSFALLGVVSSLIPP